MLNANELKEWRFSEVRKGYDENEVDELLDKVCEDYISYENLVKTQKSRIEALEKEVSENKTSAQSINTVLISAQKLADSIVADAKKSAEQIVLDANTEAESIKQRTKKALEEIDAVLTEQNNAAQIEVDKMLKEATRKAEGMILAAKDSVAREQILFDKLKGEVAAFKADIKESYKKHLESLSKLPDEVPFNAEQSAEAVEEIINNEPDFQKFVSEPETAANTDFEEIEDEAVEAVDVIIAADEKMANLDEVVSDISGGFVIKKTEQTEEIKEEEPNFSNGFFVKHNN